MLHGGHFYGGHIVLAMDCLKNCVANLADLMDRQMALLVDVKFNNVLPAISPAPTKSRRFESPFAVAPLYSPTAKSSRWISSWMLRIHLM